MAVRIVAAAIKRDGHVFSHPAPARHSHLLWDMRGIMEIKGITNPLPVIQGFLASNGEFVDRISAGRIAIAAGQIEKLTTPPELFSEDLW